ncbi:MFS multidrug transporter [Seiridium cupressi]
MFSARAARSHGYREKDKMTGSDAAGVPKTKDVVPPTFDVVGLDDSENLFKFSSARRWACTTITSVAEDFNYSRTVSTLGVSTFLFGFASGALISAPLSELYGRYPIYRINLFLFVVFNPGCALAPNIAALLVFRFLCGFFGLTTVTNSGGSFTDLWPPPIAQFH